MFKVNISNSSQNLAWSASFSTQEEAQAWLDKQIGKPHRLAERIEAIDAEYDQADVLEVIETEQSIEALLVPRVDEQNQPVLDEEGIQIVDSVPQTAMVQTHVRLKAQFTSEIIDITAQHNAEQAKSSRLQAGKAARQACESVMDLIAGYNIQNSLTAEQVSQMAATFAPIIQLLQVSRPSSAKALISAIEPDGVLVSADMKQDCLDLLAAY